MSTVPPSVPVTTQASRNEEIRVYPHSSLYYWWPVWAIGFIMFLVTYFDGSRSVILPADTEIVSNPEVKAKGEAGETRIIEGRDVLILPANERLPNSSTKPDQPEAKRLADTKLASEHMARSKNLGVIWAVALLLTIVISSVSVRGVWSIVVIVTIILFVVLFALFDWWGKIAEWWSWLRIHINAGGYFFLSAVLFIIWALNFYVFDRRTYVIFTPGQVRIREAIGQGEKVFNAESVVFHKQQNDFFKHWIWGLGSGDLELVMAKGEKFDFHNVTFVGYKVRKIEELIKMKEVV